MDSTWKITNVTSVICSPSGSVTPVTKYFGLNCLSSDSLENAIFLGSFIDNNDFKGSLLRHKSGSLHLKKLIANGDSELILLGNFEWTGSRGLLFIGTFNTKLNVFTSCKLLSDANIPDAYYEPVDLISNRGEFFILATMQIEYLNEKKNKTLLIKYDGKDIVWSKAYNVIAPIHSEKPQSIAISQTDDLLISGLVRASTDSLDRLMLMRIDSDGNPLNLKRIQLYSANHKFTNQFTWSYIKTKISTIHILAQTLGSRAEPDQILVTMFDDNLSLRTWRNYNAPIQAENALLDADFFYFGGQAPLARNYNGYSIMRINSSNAIVESFKYIQKGFDYAGRGTSSSTCYERATDKFWTIALPGTQHERKLVLIQDQRRLETNCATDLSTTVAKDTMRVNDLNLSAKDLLFQLNDFDCQVSAVNLEYSEICSATHTSDLSELKLEWHYTNNGSVEIQSYKPIDYLFVCDVAGNKVYEEVQLGYHFHLPGNLLPGIYFAYYQTKSKLQGRNKFIIY